MCRRGNGVAGGIDEIVHHDDGNVAVKKVIDDVAADIAATAGNQFWVLGAHGLNLAQRILGGKPVDMLETVFPELFFSRGRLCRTAIPFSYRSSPITVRSAIWPLLKCVRLCVMRCAINWRTWNYRPFR